MNNIFSVYRGKKVIVTGDTGFKGSWLCLWLHMLGADVLGYSLPPKREYDHYNVLGLKNMICHVDGDIRNYDYLKKIFDDFQPEFIFHLAAQSLVRLSYREPKYTFDTNVGGSVNILETARLIPSLRSLIYVTSDKCYLNKEWVWGYREDDELGGRDPYSASKAAAEMVFFGYLNTFFQKEGCFGVASVRAGNVIGGGDWAEDRIVPDCIKSLQANKPIILRNPDSTRPWQHVLEPLSGYLTLAVKLFSNPGKYSGSWNFGPRSTAVNTVHDLAQRIVKKWGSGEIQIESLENAPHEATLLHLNCDKAYFMLDWRPRWGFEQAVEETALWYKEIFHNRPAREISESQIRKYMEGTL